MRRFVINIVLIIMAFAIQNCIFPFIPFLNVAPNLVLIILFTIGFIYGKKEGMLYGIIIGLLMDLFYTGVFGFFTLIYMVGVYRRYFIQILL